MPPAVISVIYLEMTHISAEMDNVIFTRSGPPGNLHVSLATTIYLLNGHVGWFRDIHFWAYWAAAAFHVDGLHAGQWRAADGGAEGLALQAVAVRAAVYVPALLVGVGLPAEVAHHPLRNAVFYAVGTTLALSQDRSLTGYCRAGLGEAADEAVHADAAGTNVRLPGLGGQEHGPLLVPAVAGLAVVAGGRRLERRVCTLWAAGVLRPRGVLAEQRRAHLSLTHHPPAVAGALSTGVYVPRFSFHKVLSSRGVANGGGAELRLLLHKVI